MKTRVPTVSGQENHDKNIKKLKAYLATVKPKCTPSTKS